MENDGPKSQSKLTYTHILYSVYDLMSKIFDDEENAKRIEFDCYKTVSVVDMYYTFNERTEKKHTRFSPHINERHFDFLFLFKLDACLSIYLYIHSYV